MATLDIVDGVIQTDAAGVPVVAGARYSEVVAAGVAAYATPYQTDTAEDFNSGGYHGIWNGTPAYLDGPFGRAFDLTGDKYIDIDAVPGFDGVTELGVLARVKQLSANRFTWGNVVVSRLGENTGGFQIRRKSSQVQWSFSASGTSTSTHVDAGNMSEDVWQSIAAGYSDSAGKRSFWVDGTQTLDLPDSGAIALATGNKLFLGARSVGSSASRFLNGLLAEVILLDRSPTQAEASAHNAGPEPTIATAPTLVASGNTLTATAAADAQSNGTLSYYHELQQLANGVWVHVQSVIASAFNTWQFTNLADGTYRSWVIPENLGGVADLTNAVTNTATINSIPRYQRSNRRLQGNRLLQRAL